ncbi:MAG: aminomethyl-transferring glycine dehydrogenase subunit GcvPB [Phycisphaeraceae bacterium]|nr:aminomethyl-transferring glycine dehydrogenase subunit GcvPB [Phycisphaeraceae bacterium]
MASNRSMPLVFEKHSPGARATDLPALDVPETAIPDALSSATPPALPELGQLDVVRHYTALAQRNLSVDGNFYPLGSCTMKFNPPVNEMACAMPGFTGLHPRQRDEDVQGALAMMHQLRLWLAEIAGLDEVSLQPSAGAHGEYTALKVVRAYFNDPQGGHSPQRKKVLAPDTAHGTNPASCAMCGANVISVPSRDGLVDLDQLRAMVDGETAAMMITNPNTAGLFDGQIGDIADILHKAGALLYLDGANMNAIVGVARPGDFGVDVMHYNTHKTFSTPHGCGGPGAGPIAVRSFLAPYLPVPQVRQHTDGTFFLDYDSPKSIGKTRSFFGQFGVLVRCWAYLAACGPQGLRNVGQTAVLNANYLAAKLKHKFETPYFDPGKGRFCAHEFITVPRELLDRGVTLIDIAKRLIDYGIHPPTMHWPVHDCLMIEPTETESRATLDRFVEVMLQIAGEIETDTQHVKQAPHSAPISRLDEVAAARSPVLTYAG